MTPVVHKRRIPATEISFLSCKACKQIFIENYHREFGFTMEEGTLVVDDVRVRAIGLTDTVGHPPAPSAPTDLKVFKC